MPPIFPKPFKGLTPEEKFAKSALLDRLCLTVWEEKKNNKGKVRRGFLSNLIKLNQSLLSSLSRDDLNNAIRKHSKAGITSSAEFNERYREKLINSVRPSHISAQSPTPQTEYPSTEPSQTPPPASVAPSDPNLIPVTPSPPNLSVTTSPPDQKGGRPKGTTDANKKKKEMALIATLNEIAHI